MMNNLSKVVKFEWRWGWERWREDEERIKGWWWGWKRDKCIRHEWKANRCIKALEMTIQLLCYYSQHDEGNKERERNDDPCK